MGDTMKIRLVSLFLFFSVLTPIILFPQDQFKLSDPLRTNPNIVLHTLDNGLTYYILTNRKPEKRAELRLVVKAGSVLEDDDQQGLAHFVEHMAFNGTTSFPKNELVSFLEKAGVKFGPDVNAYTSFDETVYMLQVPTDSVALFRKAFQIIQEWASAVTFADDEIDKERGVVVEEWRLGRGAYERIQNKHNPIIFYKSRYADRLPIGKKDVLDTCSHEAVRRFYREWYRPNLMAVIVVGDFDPKEVELLINEKFEGLKNPSSPRVRTKYTLPDHDETLVSIASDAELPSATVNVFFKRPEEKEKTAGDYVKDISGNLYDEMLNERIGERLQQSNPPFIYGWSGDSHFVGDRQAYGLYAGVKENSILDGLDAIVTEAFRVKDHGFTATEFERVKKNVMRGMEQSYLERDKTESGAYASEIIRNFLQEEPMPGIETEYSLYKQFLPTITLDEVNRLSSLRLTATNRVATVSAPKKEGVTLPTQADVLAVLSSAVNKKFDAYVDWVPTKGLMTSLPKPGSILYEHTISSVDITEWKLSNGATVVLKPTDFKNDEILFSAFANGGLSLSPNQEYLSSRWATTAASVGGAGDFDAVSLQKALAGKIVRVSPTLNELTEGFDGGVTPEDLETLFQLTYLYFTSPRRDSSAFSALLSRQRASLQNRSASPEGAFNDTIQVTMAQYHYRVRPLTAAMLDSINLDTALRFYKDRFADASGFTFLFVGSFQTEKIRPLVEQYLASLPGLHQKEMWKDPGIMPPKGVISKEVLRGIEPKSIVRMIFTGPFDWTRQNRYDFESMLEFLNIKLREVMREDKSGVYGVGASGAPTRRPRSEYRITISFGCSPDRVDELVTTALQEIDSLKIAPPSDNYIAKVREIQRRQHEVNLKENRYWISNLERSYVNGSSPEVILKYPQLIDSLTAADVHHAAMKYFDPSNYVKIVLKPEKR